MSERSAHLTAMSLEQLAEGNLPEREAVRARSHLQVCGRCSAELESYRSLFLMLGELPRFAPSPAFADAVMARVSIAPQEHFVAAWLRRLIPSTRRGWILLGTVVTAPVTPFLALAALLLLQPLVTPTTLWQWLQIRTATAGQSSMSWLIDQTVGNSVPQLAEITYAVMQAVPGSAIGIVVAILAVAIPISAWSLIRLIRIPVSRVTYAN